MVRLIFLLELHRQAYKLGENDYAWLLQQKRVNPALSAAKLQQLLRTQRKKEIGQRAINIILRKHGLSSGRGGQSQQLSGEPTVPLPREADTEGLPQLAGGEKSVPSRQKTKQKRRDHRRKRSSRQPKVLTNKLSPAALGWLVKRCRRDPGVSNEELQTILKSLGMKISILKLENTRRKLGIPSKSSPFLI